MPDYAELGMVWTKPGVGTPTIACKSCGAVVSEFLKDQHNNFHAALAELFEAVVR